MRCWREVLEVVADHEQNPVSLRDELPAYSLSAAVQPFSLGARIVTSCSVKQDADLFASTSRVACARPCGRGS